ncbi:4-hydroxyphenylacetate 3-hydroxylase family protein [Paenibacillus sanfengchensis]|uniref:4-hydroxyphenylacetate 3-hydroxylase family protein n=1 Tax=Paenibacillus sanfengchensis TaxID=3119819 RepID=UPI002FE3FEAC
MPFKNGRQYIERIDRQRINLWYRGERVSGPLSEHPAFRGLIRTQADLYDLQGDEEYLDRMTYLSPLTGERVGLSYLPPVNADDLVRRRQVTEIWSGRHHGFLGRSPDYMNTALMSFYTAASALEQNTPEYARNLRNYYAYCRENDITLSHAFVQPLASKWSEPADTEESITAKVIETNEKGIVVSGAFIMATQGPTCEEIMVFPSPAFSLSEAGNPTAFAFAVPNDLDGITFICRESYARDSAYDHPLSSRFEEMDTLVVLDRVLVPHDRVFFYGDEGMFDRLFREGNFHAYAGHQILSRYIAKTEFLLGLMLSLAEEQNSATELTAKSLIARVMMMLENLRALRLTSETTGYMTPNGYYVPGSSPLIAANLQFPDYYDEMIHTIQKLSASNLIMNPFEADLSSPPKKYLEVYLKGISSSAKERIALFRLAWELGAGPFGGRQSQFERFFFGNANTTANRMYQSCQNQEDYKALVHQLIGKDLSQESGST